MRVSLKSGKSIRDFEELYGEIVVSDKMRIKSMLLCFYHSAEKCSVNDITTIRKIAFKTNIKFLQ